MNANELAYELEADGDKEAANMIRQQLAEIEALKAENQELSALCVEFNVLRKVGEK